MISFLRRLADEMTTVQWVANVGIPTVIAVVAIIAGVVLINRQMKHDRLLLIESITLSARLQSVRRAGQISLAALQHCSTSPGGYGILEDYPRELAAVSYAFTEAAVSTGLSEPTREALRGIEEVFNQLIYAWYDCSGIAEPHRTAGNEEQLVLDIWKCCQAMISQYEMEAEVLFAWDGLEDIGVTRARILAQDRFIDFDPHAARKEAVRRYKELHPPAA